MGWVVFFLTSFFGDNNFVQMMEELRSERFGATPPGFQAHGRIGYLISRRFL